MNNNELIINGQLVDTDGDLGVRLNRKLIDPSALNTVDAQFSYTISLPPTQRNMEVFNYAMVEETRDKFNRVYVAELIVKTSRIFGPGLFRLTACNDDGIKGQLYLPVKKTVKDIFGELKLNQNAPYILPFLDFAEYVNLYNNAAAVEPQAAIFPYVLYGVLPKIPLNKNANVYSARNLWDDSVRLGISDLAPAINPLIMLKHIFTSRGYTLQGTAFQDDKLAKLYQTYKNAPDYVQPWNYGYHAKMHVTGGWSSRYNYRTGGEQLERGAGQSADSTGPLYTCDLLDATNASLNVLEDTGGNVLRKEINDGSGMTWLQGQIRIPTSGLYKINFDASLHVYDSENWRATDPVTRIQHVGGRTDNARNDFGDNMYGMRLVRDRKTADFGILGGKFDGVFYYNNQPQNRTFDGNNVPKYFPQVGDGQMNFVDAAQDKNIIVGFEFGRHEPVASGGIFTGLSVGPANPEFYNPKAGLGPYAQLVVAKPATSWDSATGNDNPTRLAIKAPGYWKYGRIGNFDNEGDNPNIDLDYSAGARITGKVLDDDGMPQDPSIGNLGVRFVDYALNAATGFATPRAGWEASDFIDVLQFTNIEFSAYVGAASTDVAVVAFYDFNLQFIGTGIAGAASPQIFTNEPVVLPPDAAYVKISGNTGSALHSYPQDFTPLTMVATGHAGLQYVNKVPLTLAGRLVSLRVKANIGDTITPYAFEITDTPLGFTLLHTYPSFITTSTEHNENITDGFAIAAGQYVGYKSSADPVFGIVSGANAWEISGAVIVAFTDVKNAYDFVIEESGASSLTITADSKYAVNVILSRFALARFYTYKIEAPLGSGYTGFAYVHDGIGTSPSIVAEFIDGVAEFNTSMAPLISFDPKLTLYLKTPDFDVDGTLTISRQITGGSEDVIDWEVTNKYKIDLDNAPANFSRRGQYNHVAQDANWYAQGAANLVVWLDAGELISVASISSEGRYREDGMHSTFGLASHEIVYDLSITPFRVEDDWLKVDSRGNGTAVMDWNDPTSFDVDHIDLVKFLSADMKTDEYIENFKKAYNLELSQISATTFSLDVKQSKTATSNLYIDLDKIASVKMRENTPLGLPSQYVLGFTIDPEEEGFVVTGETGGGTFDTGATEISVVTQTSAFSYNWYKAITKVEVGGNITINLPVISKAEVWGPDMPYPDAMKQHYSDLAQRFMYYAGILPGTYKYNGSDLKIANVSNELPGASILDYKNKLHTILYNYFTLLINGASHYTNIKAFLDPVQYMQLNGTLSVKFNGDMYLAAELTGYDPNNKNQTTIKLIRKI